ncbi:OLC1v1034978C1 [Oldenlandia corymbosa var. corymbosa]|uniref:OLC1v1034978C1 n=1 Tax=Oldenlandia corymbosa var. corymbosa TaxID=529605 RepID=A0AAV1CSM7_OLDCO|nr:OLC1v1034978C1 [Oldenlandia corymbosa var. corymbosa]
MEASRLSCPPICRPVSSLNKCRAPRFSDGTGLPLRKGMIVLSRLASQPYLLKPCRVKSEDSEGTLTGESIIGDEQTLEQDLQNAIKEENYVRAAEIRDTLRSLQSDSKASVLAANARFYEAFRNGNLAAMQALWSKGDNVCVVHPGVSGISGYDSVMGSWEIVWAEYEFPLQIDILDVQVHVKGDVGYVTCIEKVKTKGSSWGKQFATNVFEKIDGQWHICVHHASYVDL